MDFIVGLFFRFKQNRLSKFGLEYDVFDSEEEDMIKERSKETFK